VTPRVDVEGRARIIGFMKSHPEGFASLQEAADAVAAYLPHRTKPTDTSGLQRNLRRCTDRRWRWHWDPDMLDSFEPSHQEAVERYSVAARRIRVPTLLLRGRRSSLVTAENVQHFKTLIPHAEFQDVADAEHMIAGDQNDAFNDAIVAFLTRQWRSS
jgi:pimeloyl-ACP methyl ester carboxylesterase